MKHLIYFDGIFEFTGYDTNIGININDSEVPWTNLILSKQKTIETRNTNTLKPYIGKKVGIIRTGKGQAQMVGFMRLGEPKVYNTLDEFRADESLHRVASGSIFDWIAPKFGYPIYDVEPIVPPKDITSKGIVSRKIERNMYKFKDFVNEAIDTKIDELLKSVDPEKAKFSDIGIDISDYADKDIEFLYDDAKFNSELYKQNLKKSELQSSLDLEEFLVGDIKFFFLYDRNTPKLGNPKFIILQYKYNKWSDIRIYLVRDNIRNFFEKLTAKTIELNDGGTTYIYQTSNSGNNWKLMNIERKNDTYKETLEADELKEIVDRGVNIKIIE